MPTPPNQLRDTVKHQTPIALTIYETRRVEALAREHYGILPTQLMRRWILDQLAEHATVDVSQPHPDTVPTAPQPPLG
jgi:hypothetical protein